jgi:hypothetical protein
MKVYTKISNKVLRALPLKAMLSLCSLFFVIGLSSANSLEENLVAPGFSDGEIEDISLAEALLNTPDLLLEINSSDSHSSRPFSPREKSEKSDEKEYDDDHEESESEFYTDWKKEECLRSNSSKSATLQFCKAFQNKKELSLFILYHSWKSTLS